LAEVSESHLYEKKFSDKLNRDLGYSLATSLT